MLAWPQMLRLGLGQLRLRPADFWALTPAELLMMLGLGDGPATLTRDGLETLMDQFPDKKEHKDG